MTQLKLQSTTADSPIAVWDGCPQFIKYMGCKAKLIDFVVEGIQSVHSTGAVCDLFAGSSILSGAIGRSVKMLSNDIQAYSATLAKAYLFSWREKSLPAVDHLVAEAAKIVAKHRQHVPGTLSYDGASSLHAFDRIDRRNRSLIEQRFPHRWHLFLKFYSGTWWSAEQCLWIDALRQVAERYRERSYYDLILACLMHAMAYNSQGTGHYAQYRDATDLSSLSDIMVYRLRSVPEYFIRKYVAFTGVLPTKRPQFKHEVTALDYRERLASLPRCTVYADPPYQFVHYSRFYHAIETLVKYDYPQLQRKNGEIVKGRYREDRHQSPFCIRTQVLDAFRNLFEGIAASSSNLVLSYSNSGMVTLDELTELAADWLGKRYSLELLTTDHKHMTMGRREDRDRQVEECLILAKRN